MTRVLKCGRVHACVIGLIHMLRIDALFLNHVYVTIDLAKKLKDRADPVTVYSLYKSSKFATGGMPWIKVFKEIISSSRYDFRRGILVSFVATSFFIAWWMGRSVHDAVIFLFPSLLPVRVGCWNTGICMNV